MADVNYIREHRAFFEMAADERLTGHEQLLWNALFMIMNSKAQGTQWPDGFIRISNKRLMTYLPYQFDAMAKARNGLIQRGLIEFVHGKKNTMSPMYKMHWLTAPEIGEEPDEEAGNTGCYPVKTDNMKGNNRGNVQGNTEGNKRLIVYKQNVSKENENDIAAAAAVEDAFLRARGVVEEGYRKAFGRQANPSEVDSITRWCMQARMEDDLIQEILNHAALHNAKSPAAYIRHMTMICQYGYMRTAADYAQDRAYRDLGDEELAREALAERRMRYADP